MSVAGRVALRYATYRVEESLDVNGIVCFQGEIVNTEQAIEILDEQIEYRGGDISVQKLESTIHSERQLQDEQVSELNSLRSRNSELQNSLGDELEKLRDLSDHLERERERSGIVSGVRNLFASMPWFEGQIVTKNSIEEMLRAQYEVSAVRVREAAEFADRLEVAQVNLYDEIERLNERIVESAENEELATARINEVEEAKATLEAAKQAADPESPEARQLQAHVDEATRVLAKHAGLLKLYSTAESRLERLIKNTRQLAETISYLRNDITLYVTAASEKLDVIAGQIQAIGAAADASVVMLEMKHSLEALTEAVNETSRFVTETQTYFRENVDGMVDDLQLYDEETEMAFEENLTFNEVFEEVQGCETVDSALAKEIEALADDARQEADVEVDEEVVLEHRG